MTPAVGEALSLGVMSLSDNKMGKGAARPPSDSQILRPASVLDRHAPR